MKSIINTSYILFLLFITTLHYNTNAQEKNILRDFYKAEQESWKEYIANYKLFNNTNSNIDIQFYHIDINISIQSPYISGSVLNKFKITNDNTNQIKLNLFQGFTIDSITGNVHSFSFINDSIFITLDAIYSTGDSAQVKVYYQGVPQLAGGYKGLRYETHAGNQPIIASLSTPFLAHYWWPCKDGPGDKADSVYIDITIPDTTVSGISLMAVSNGILENTFANNGLKTFYWRERYPIVPYYVMVAISNYTNFQHMYTFSPVDSFPIDYYVFSEHLTTAQAGVSQLPQTMSLFSDYFGTYPFAEEKYAMTQLGFYGAIENQTNTIQNNMSLSWFEISVHELAHMWFGDMITCETWQHGWLNEGFATYSEALWEEHIGGFQAYKNKISGNRYWSGGTLYLQDISNPFNIFIGIIYDKGSYVLHMLRGVLGDSVFFDCINNYATHSSFMYDHATTEDFRMICETTSGMDLAFFFDQWIYDEYYPRYNFGYYQNSTTLETSIQIEQTQHQYGWRSVFEMPIQLKLNFADNSDTLITIWNDSLIQSYQFNLSKLVTDIEFDPDEWILRTYQINGFEGQGTKADKFVLFQNFPNPFNPTTTIRYELPKSSHVKLDIYDLLGQKIRTLKNSIESAGNKKVVWDGKDNLGIGVSSGMYFYQIDAGIFKKSRKMLLIR